MTEACLFQPTLVFEWEFLATAKKYKPQFCLVSCREMIFLERFSEACGFSSFPPLPSFPTLSSLMFIIVIISELGSTSNNGLLQRV